MIEHLIFAIPTNVIFILKTVISTKEIHQIHIFQLFFIAVGSASSALALAVTLHRNERRVYTMT